MNHQSKDRNSYSSILKSISLFGGVKIFQIIVGIFRNKVAAVLLGPSGIGVITMLTSSVSLVQTITGFGLHTSAVRDIANATSSKDELRIGRVIAVLRKLVILTGLLGTIAVFVFAQPLSLMSFGNSDYKWAFRIVSIVALLDQLIIGQTALLQGTFHYRLMAKSALWGSIIGLVVSVPLYYLWGKDAIVPVLILTSFTGLLLSTYYCHQIHFVKVNINWPELRVEGRQMMVLGLAIAMSGVVGLGSKYLLRIFISNTGGISDVGLFGAGIALSTQYVDVIFSSMGSDYGPRLASLADDISTFVDAINRQIRLLLTIITPLLLLFIIVAHELTLLLYSSEFVEISGMMEWMMLGMFFRAVSWCLSFAMIARGESKIFFWNEFAISAASLILSAVGYYFSRFAGLGVAFVMTYILYSIQMYYLGKRYFDFVFARETLYNIISHLLLLVISFAILTYINFTLGRYFAGGVLFLVVSWFSIREFNKMIPVSQKIMSIFKYCNQSK